MPRRQPRRRSASLTASATRPADWGTHAEATAAHAAGGYDGIGFIPQPADDGSTGPAVRQLAPRAGGEREANQGALSPARGAARHRSVRPQTQAGFDEALVEAVAAQAEAKQPLNHT